jgi:predicted GTPase
MNRIINSLRLGKRFTKDGLPLLMILLCIPVAVLIIFGFIALYQLGYMLYFVVLLSGISLVYFLVLLRLKKSMKAQVKESVSHDQESNSAEGLVDPNTDWSEFDLQVWHELNSTMDQLLQQQDSWEILREHALALVSATARHYRPNKANGELAITLPELLAMTEEVSRRYHRIILEHLPFAEQIHISRLKQIYQYRDKTEQIEQIWQAYRAFRLFTPTGIIAEIRSQITGHLLDEVKEELKLNLKKAFLQEVVSVAIDLYSGRFQHPFDIEEKNETVENELPPLRICLIGQLNSGKSTLTNLLLREIRAESSPIPSTDEKHVYQLDTDGQSLIHLVDLPGFDATESTQKLLLKEVSEADMVIWLLKANQPARALDTEFKEAYDGFFNKAEMRSRKRPALIGVLTHIDQLPRLKEWQPPYSLDSKLNEGPKALAEQQLKDALEYNQSLLKIETLVPLCSAPDKSNWGLDQFLTELDNRYQDARQTQLNRLKLSRSKQISFSKEFRRIYRIGDSLFQRWRTGSKDKGN